MKLLIPGRDFVSRTIRAAAKSGRSKTYQGRALITLLSSRAKSRDPGAKPNSLATGFLDFARNDGSLCALSLESKSRNVFHVGRLPGVIERDNDRKADRDFGGGDGDDEEDEDLGVVARQSRRGHAKARERNQRQVRRVQHQLERHKDDDDVAAEEHAGKPDREKHSADDEIMAER